MISQEQYDQLVEYIQIQYDAEDGGLSSMNSYGNADDVFRDGEASGKAWELYSIASIICLEVDEIKEVNLDDI